MATGVLSQNKHVGLASATGLVIASMIGSGVFVTSGFMARDLSPSAILAGWLVGGLLALCGAACYAAVAERIPRSGGEYRYLHDVYHPFAGYLAGWTSIVFGFAGPIAMAAMAAGAYADVLLFKGAALPLAIVLVLGLGLVQAGGVNLGAPVQNFGVLLKVATILVFLAGALISGASQPAQALPTPDTARELASLPFAVGQIYIGFAFAGWNVAAYMASEVKDSASNVPRAMFMGCIAVTIIYFLLNFVFVTTLPAEKLAEVASTQDRSLTLGHLVAIHLMGETGGRLASAMVFLVQVSAVCAFTMTGPRVCDAMARDGFLPEWVRWRDGRLGGLGPVGLVTGLATVMLLSNTYEALLNAVGVTLAIFGALSATAILKLEGRKLKPHLWAALVIFVGGVAWSVL
ncbi:MAG: APC family permease, partial [Candidatus Sericytochromatia bacterium]|nr:APC family permease [Candidatus Tanganyikabacteria bacterium]